MTQWVKDPVLPLQRLKVLLWYRFEPWPRIFPNASGAAKKRKKKKKRKLEEFSSWLSGNESDWYP